MTQAITLKTKHPNELLSEARAALSRVLQAKADEPADAVRLAMAGVALAQAFEALDRSASLGKLPDGYASPGRPRCTCLLRLGGHFPDCER